MRTMDLERKDIFLWIQNVPDSGETILSMNGKPLTSGTSGYIKAFDKITKYELAKYKVLTCSLKRLKKKGDTYISGNFLQTDKMDRRICYRACLKAKNRVEVCDLLIEEAQKYNCTISEEDIDVLKTKRYEVIVFFITILIVIILFILWLINCNK